MTTSDPAQSTCPYIRRKARITAIILGIIISIALICWVITFFFGKDQILSETIPAIRTPGKVTNIESSCFAPLLIDVTYSIDLRGLPEPEEDPVVNFRKRYIWLFGYYQLIAEHDDGCHSS